MSQIIADIGRRVLDRQALDRATILSLVQAATEQPYELMHWAWQIRQQRFGRDVAFCSIIPGKLGGCGEDCKWCAQSASHAAEPTAPQITSFADIEHAAKAAAEHHAGCFCIVNSGRKPTAGDVQSVASTAQALYKNIDGGQMCVSASLGELTPDHARQLAAAGVKRYNHNLETSRRHYAKMVTSHTYDDRLAALRNAQQAGMQLCCGGIFGMGETWDDRIDLALTLRDEVKPVVTTMNFLHPIPGTPLENTAPLPPLEILSIIAVFRFILPQVDLKICGGRGVNLRDLQSWIFYAGATSCLVGQYLTTSGRGVPDDIRMAGDLGLRVVQELPSPDWA